MGIGFYRNVDVRTWDDESYRTVSGPAPNAQTLWWHLLTGPQTTALPGLYQCGLAQLSEQLRWDPADTRRCFAELEERDMARADWDARLIWLPRAVRHNPPCNRKHAIGWRRYIEALPRCPLLDDAIMGIRETLKQLDQDRAADARLRNENPKETIAPALDSLTRQAQARIESRSAEYAQRPDVTHTVSDTLSDTVSDIVSNDAKTDPTKTVPDTVSDTVSDTHTSPSRIPTRLDRPPHRDLKEPSTQTRARAKAVPDGAACAAGASPSAPLVCTGIDKNSSGKTASVTKRKPRAKRQASEAEVAPLLEAWTIATGAPPAFRGRDRQVFRQHVQARLSEGYSVEELAQCVRWVAEDEWYRDKRHIRLAVHKASSVQHLLGKARAPRSPSIGYHPGSSYDEAYQQDLAEHPDPDRALTMDEALELCHARERRVAAKLNGAVAAPQSALSRFSGATLGNDPGTGIYGQ